MNGKRFLLPALLLIAAPALANEGGEGGLPQLDPQWFASQAFWLAVHFLVLYVIAAKLILPNLAKALSSRESRIAAELALAKNLGVQAAETRAACDALLQRARANAKAARDATIAEGKDKRLQAELAQSAKLVKRIEEAHDRLEQAGAVMRSHIREVAAEMTQDIVQKVTGTPTERGAVDAALGRILDVDMKEVA